MIKIQHQTELLKELAAQGVLVDPAFVPELLNTGVDTFLEHRGIYLTEKQLTTLRLIMHCIGAHE